VTLGAVAYLLGSSVPANIPIIERDTLAFQGETECKAFEGECLQPVGRRTITWPNPIPKKHHTQLKTHGIFVYFVGVFGTLR